MNIFCDRHQNQVVSIYCIAMNLLICKECLPMCNQVTHKSDDHIEINEKYKVDY